jgi:cardiolipin synthase
MLPLRLRGDCNRWDLRNHRKILVVDGEIAYTGSLNLIQPNYHRRDAIVYDEQMARVSGPAADALDAVFRTDWYSETGEQLGAEGNPEHAVELRVRGQTLCQVLPSGSGFDNENNLKLYVALIHAARHTIVICNPYFVPDEALMLALVSAALRGVDVTLVNSEVHDQFLVAYAQRSYYEELLRAGVKIRLYRTPTLLHTKTMTVDDDIAVIGSSNLDMRSFQLNLEVTLACFDQGVVAEMRRAEATYAERSRSLDLDAWRQRPLPERLFENVTRLMSAIL